MPEAPPAPPVPSTPAVPASRPAPDISGRTFNDADAFAALDAISTDDGMPSDVPEQPETPDEKMSRVRDEITGKFTKAPEKPAEKSAEKAKAPDKPAEKAPEKPQDTPEEIDEEKAAPKQLREAYKAQKARLAAIVKERDEFKTRATKPAEDPEKQTLTQR